MSQSASTRALTALGDPTRARILRLIRDAEDGRARVGLLAAALQLRQPTISHHMKALHAEGIVARQPEGRQVWYSIAPAQAERVDALLGTSDQLVADPDLERITADLALRFRGVLSRETVGESVRESYELLARGSRSPLLASRTAVFAATRLEAVSRANAGVDGIPTVLFVCVKNAGRSQIAAGILRQLAGDRIAVRTAGSAPASEVRPTVIAALDEIGVPIGSEFPKPLTDEAVRAADVVVTMGCGDACPVYPGRRYLDWDLDDPVDKPLEQVRVIRDDIDARVRRLLGELDRNDSSRVRRDQ